MSDIPDRVKKLEDIELLITTALQNAGIKPNNVKVLEYSAVANKDFLPIYLGNALAELSKDSKPNDKNLDKFTGNFVLSLEKVESDLNKQIMDLQQVKC